MTDDPKVELVARALHAVEESWHDYCWEQLPEEVQAEFSRQARAAIAALASTDADQRRIVELEELLEDFKSAARLPINLVRSKRVTVPASIYHRVCATLIKDQSRG